MPIPIPMADEPKGLGTPGAVQVHDSGATSVADAISKLGAQGAKLAEHMLQQRTQLQGDAYVSNALSTYQQEYLNKTQELEQKYAGTDGIGLHKEMMNWNNETQDRMRKGAPSAVASGAFDQGVTKLSTSALINADTTEQKLFTTYHTKKIDEHLKDLTNSVPNFRDQIVEKTESSFLSYKDSLALAQSMGLINTQDADDRDKAAGAQFALAAGNNLASRGDFSAVARIIGGGERFVPMAIAFMDKYYPPGTKENNDARAYMMKKIKATGAPMNPSKLEGYLTAEQKESLIRDTMRNMKVDSEVESSDLNERIKEMNAKLQSNGIPTDAETVQQMGALIAEINSHEKFTPFQKLNRTLGFHIRMAGGEMARVFKVLPQSKGMEIINEFKRLDFSNPANQKKAEEFMTQMGFTPETKALFMKNPTIAASAIKEISSDLLRKHDSFWNDMNKDSGNTLYLENQGVRDQWDKAMESWNLTGDATDILNSKEFQKAIIMTKSLESQMGVSSNKATTIPIGVANAMMSDVNALYQQGNYQKVDVALDSIKSVLSLKDQYPGMFNNIEKRMIEASNDDFFTAETAFIMRLPSGPERQQLIRNNTPEGQKFIKDKIEESGFSEGQFSDILIKSPQWRQFQATMAGDMYSAIKGEGLKKMLTNELVRISTKEGATILGKEAPASIDKLVTPKHIQQVMTNYIDKNYTVFASGGARITLDNGAVQDAIKQWSPEDQYMAKAPRFNEALMLSAELTSRDTALWDANVVVPQAFIDQAASHVKAGKGIFSVAGVTARLDDPMTVKRLFLDSAVMYAEGNDAFVFKVGDAVLLDKTGQPYRIKTSDILNSEILKDYVRGGTEKAPLFDYFIENKLERMQRKSKKVGTEVKRQGKLEDEAAEKQQEAAEEALEERLDL